ncbi:MAG: sensor histidine kinase [Chitinophagaceae bacterium]
MPRRIFFIYHFLISPFFLFAQSSPDSIVNSRKDSLKVIGLLFQTELIYKSDLAKAKTLTQEALRISEELKNETLIACTYNSLAVLERKNQNSQLLQYDSLFIFHAENANSAKLIPIAYYYYAIDLMHQEKMSMANRILTKGIQVTEKNKDDRNASNLNYAWGIYYNQQNQFNQASNYFTKSLDLATHFNDQKLIADNKRWIGQVSVSAASVTEQTRDLVFEALDYYIKNNNFLQEAACYDILGFAFHTAQNENKAIEYYLKGRDLFSKIADPVRAANDDLSIAQVYLSKKNIDSSAYYLDEAKKIFSLTSNAKGLVAEAILRIDLLKLQKNYEGADKIAADATAKNKALKNDNLGILLNESISILKAHEGKSDSAAYYALEKIKAVRKQYPPAVLSNLLDKYLKKFPGEDKKVIASIKKVWGVTDSAYKDLTDEEFYSSLKKIETMLANTDSMPETKQQEQIIAAETRFQTQRTKDSLQLQQKENTIQAMTIRTKNNWLIAAVAISILILLIAVQQFYYRRKIEGYRIELRHRSLNLITIIKSAASKTGKYSNDKISFNKLELRLQAIGEIQDVLYQENETNIVSANKYLQLLENLYNTVYAPGKIIINTTEKFMFPSEKTVDIGLIINEFVTNSFKHAFTENKDGIVHVNLSKTLKGDYKLSISDNGKGFIPNDGKGSGMDIVETLVGGLKGSLKKYNDEGANFEIIFM